MARRNKKKKMNGFGNGMGNRIPHLLGNNIPIFPARAFLVVDAGMNAL